MFLRYSPSLPMEEEEQQQETIDKVESTRPKPVQSVLGKAQAKKRLLAFSIAKQSSQIAAKKITATSNPLIERKEKDHLTTPASSAAAATAINIVNEQINSIDSQQNNESADKSVTAGMMDEKSSANAAARKKLKRREF